MKISTPHYLYVLHSNYITVQLFFFLKKNADQPPIKSRAFEQVLTQLSFNSFHRFQKARRVLEGISAAPRDRACTSLPL